MKLSTAGKSTQQKMYSTVGRMPTNTSKSLTGYLSVPSLLTHHNPIRR